MDFIKIGKLFAQDYYAVPDYQRDYEWTNSQNATLLDDLLSIAKDGNGSNHFFGAIVTIPYEDGTGVNKSIDFEDYGIDWKENVKHIVDGQQRLSSFSVLISALRDLINEDDTISDVFKQNYASRQLAGLLLGNAFKASGEESPRLILNGNTGNCYNTSILKVSNSTFNKRLKGAKRLLAAYALYKSDLQTKLNEWLVEGVVSSSEEYYKRIVEALTKKVVFVEIECDASSDAFQVFDSLNGKGLDLTAADRIKNIFMSWSPKGKGAQKWDALVNDIGEDYLANFFVSMFFFKTGRRVAKNKLPEEFKNTYKVAAQNDFDYFFNELKKDGILFGNLRGLKTGIVKLDSLLQDFNSLNLDQVYVIIFAAALHYGANAMKTDEYIEFVKVLQTLIVRMQVCEKSMNKLDSLFSVCIGLMKNGGASLTAITKKLNEEISNTVDDDQFIKAFKNFTPADHKVAEFYLRHIEEFIRKKNGNRSPVERGLTVEHIIPQLYDLDSWYGESSVPEEIKDDFKESIVEHIGNKILLYGDDNTAASNENYSIKCNTYITGKRGQNAGTPVDTFQMVAELLSIYPDRFNHEEVFDRAERLAEYAVEIWKL